MQKQGKLVLTSSTTDILPNINPKANKNLAGIKISFIIEVKDIFILILYSISSTEFACCVNQV